MVKAAFLSLLLCSIRYRSFKCLCYRPRYQETRDRTQPNEAGHNHGAVYHQKVFSKLWLILALRALWCSAEGRYMGLQIQWCYWKPSLKCMKCCRRQTSLQHLFLFTFLSSQFELYKATAAWASGAREYLKSSEWRAMNVAQQIQHSFVGLVFFLFNRYK